MQPIFTELAVVDTTPLHTESERKSAGFCPAAVVRIGRLELELSNSVSPGLMKQLRAMVGDAE